MRSERLVYGFGAEKLFDPQPQLANESLPSWVARNAIENELPNITTILRDVGQVHRACMADVMRTGIDVDGLATILGSDPAAIQALRCHELDGGRMRYLGVNVRLGDVHAEARRFAPAALAGDDVPFYRAAWLLKTFPICTETWQVLRSSCDCGGQQTWATVGTTVLCRNCGGDLRELDAEPVAEHARAGLRRLGEMLFGCPEDRAREMDRLPVELRSLDPGDVLELALLIARIVDPTMGNPRELVWRDEPGRLAAALGTASDLLPAWPDTLWLALRVTSDPGRLLPRSKQLVSLQKILSREWAANVSGPVGDLIDAIREEVTLDDDDGRHRLVDLNDAERILRMTKRSIRTARADGHLGTAFVIRRGEILPGYERSRLETLAATIDWPSARSVAKRLGIPPYGLEQLCAMDEVAWAKAPQRTVRLGLLVDPRSLRDVAERMRVAAIPANAMEDPVPLTTAMRGIGGREKPWGPVVRMLTEGDLPFAIAPSGDLRRGISIERRDVDRIRATSFERSEWSLFDFDTEMSQTDALDVLNIHPRDRARIKRYRTCCRSGTWIYERLAVSSLATRFVTLGELGARHLMQSKTAAMRLRRAGPKPVAFGYDRLDATARFDAADPTPSVVRWTRS